MSSIRDKIVKIAIEEGTPRPYGKVTDMVRDAGGNRAGWKRLKEYFEVACGWSEQNWKMTGDILTPQNEKKHISFLQGVQIPTYRVPQPGKPSGISWCGIFATWVLIKAGLNVKWTAGGITGDKVKLTAGSEGIAPGDVIVMQGAEVHHAVVSQMPDIYEGDGSMETVNGNSGSQSIVIHSHFFPKKVWYYYRILD